MDAERQMAWAEVGGDRRTFQNVRGDDVWTLVCLGGVGGRVGVKGVGGGFRILRNGLDFAAWDAWDAARALRAYQGLTGRWAMPAGAAAGA